MKFPHKEIILVLVESMILPSAIVFLMLSGIVFRKNDLMVNSDML